MGFYQGRDILTLNIITVCSNCTFKMSERSNLSFSNCPCCSKSCSVTSAACHLLLNLHTKFDVQIDGFNLNSSKMNFNSFYPPNNFYQSLTGLSSTLIQSVLGKISQSRRRLLEDNKEFSGSCLFIMAYNQGMLV